jgi:hypothetical protein
VITAQFASSLFAQAPRRKPARPANYYRGSLDE